jgi:hypothetical protein
VRLGDVLQGAVELVDPLAVRTQPSVGGNASLVPADPLSQAGQGV